MIRVGICLVPFNTSYAKCREAALATEAAGFESLWTWDHLISFNDDAEPVLECWTTLAALAELTERVKLGSFVTNVMSRHPDVLAKAIATIQQISGAGWSWASARERGRGSKWPTTGLSPAVESGSKG